MEEKKGFVGEFKEFIARGNVVDMAVGVIIGGAFGKISTSLVNDVIMPAVSMLTGGVDFSEWKIVLKEAVMAADGVTTEVAEVAIKYGSFLSTILDFFIIALSVFCMVKVINGVRRKMERKEAVVVVEEPAPEAPPAPTAEELLTEILAELRKGK